MKKSIFLILCIISTFALAQSPVQKGVYSIGGTISYISSSGDNYESSTDFDVAPIFGYFFIDNLYSGISVYYSYRSTDNYTNEAYGIGPTIKYFFDFQEKLIPFLGVGYSYNSLNEDLSRDAFFGSVGADYFIKRYFSVELNFTYRISKYNGPDIFGLTGEVRQLFISLGANYYID